MYSGIINLSDSLPASQLEIISYAFNIMNIRIPKYIDYSAISKDMSPSIRRFWENNRRVNNLLLKKKYGDLLYPTYKDGIKSLYQDYILQSSNKD